MKELNYKKIKASTEAIRRFSELERSIEDRIVKKYCKGNKDEYLHYSGSLSYQMGKILTLTSLSISDKRILDLGCGSISNYGFFDKKNSYQPWLCRFLYELGADPIGIDIANLDNEEFKYYGEFDLFKPDSLAFIPENSIDIANASKLFNSPEVARKRNGISSQSTPNIVLKNILMPQLERLVKPNGFFIHDL